MDLKTQIIQEYLMQGGGFRKLGQKYGISRTTICKWVMIYQGIHNLPLTEKQQKHSLYSMSNKHNKLKSEEHGSAEALQQKIAALEKQLEWEKLRVEALDTMINIAEKDLNISIRKKPGAQQ
jgi:transposase-like protein